MRTRKKILFILSGSISAYKTLDLLRNLVKKNFEVETILTKSGSEFVSPLSISSITKRKIYQNMFSKKKNCKSYGTYTTIKKFRFNSRLSC